METVNYGRNKFYDTGSRSALPRLEPEKAIGTFRALPRLPSTRLDCHAVYILYICFAGLTLSPLGTEFPYLIVSERRQ
jgi:hypothetical protein